MSRPTPIDTQSSNALKRAGTRIIQFLSPRKSDFSPTSPRKFQKPLPPFEPQKLLASAAALPESSKHGLQRVSSHQLLRPSDSRASLRPPVHSRPRSKSPDSRHYRERSRDSRRSHHRSMSKASMRSFDSRLTREEPYRDPDDRDFHLKKDYGLDTIDGIKHLWTNLYLGKQFIGHFYCRQEPRLYPDCFFPGMIIWATHSVFQNNQNAVPGDPLIGITKQAPVYAKMRPMIVLYPTNTGLCCAPMFSLNNRKDRSGEKQYEYFSITEEGDDWEGETRYYGVLTFRPHAGRRRELKSRTFVRLHQTMYVSTREYIETDLGYLPGDQYNRLIIALDFYQETRKHIAYNYFQEQYKNRGMRLLAGGDVGQHESDELKVQNGRMRDYQPVRDDRTMVWSLLGKKKELMGSKSKSADWGRLELDY